MVQNEKVFKRKKKTGKFCKWCLEKNWCDNWHDDIKQNGNKNAKCLNKYDFQHNMKIVFDVFLISNNRIWKITCSNSRGLC